jgi:ABC-type multidrug transport system fused ATPase/permease subunit
MKKIQNKKNVMIYLKRHKWAVALYLITVLCACSFSVATTLLMANFLSNITMGKFLMGFNLLIIAGVTTVRCRACWWLNYYIYIKNSNIIWKEIAKDLTKRSFELSTSAFSDNNSGAFVQRIMNDPNDVLNKLSSLVEILAELITQTIVVVYIITLNCSLFFAS